MVFRWHPPHTHTHTSYTYTRTNTCAHIHLCSHKDWLEEAVFFCSQPPPTCPTAPRSTFACAPGTSTWPSAWSPHETSKIAGWRFIIIHHLFSYLPISFQPVALSVFSLWIQSLKERDSSLLNSYFNECLNLFFSYVEVGIQWEYEIYSSSLPLVNQHRDPYDFWAENQKQKTYRTLGLLIHVCREEGIRKAV